MRLSVLTSLSQLLRIHCAVVLFISYSARADNPSPELIDEEGKPLIVRWSDGNEARFFYSVEDTVTMHMPFSVIRSDCGAILPKRCEWTFSEVRERTLLKWTKHIDSKKIGGLVKIAYNLNSPKEKRDAYRDTNQYNSLTRYGTKPVPFKIPEMAMHCDSMQWLGKIQNNSFSLSKWSSQGMTLNRDTQITENYLETLFEGVHFKKRPSGRWGLENLDVSFKSDPTLAQNDAGIDVFDIRTDDDHCQVILNSDLTKSRPDAASLANMNNAPKETEVLAPASESIKTAVSYFFFTDYQANNVVAKKPLEVE